MATMTKAEAGIFAIENLLAILMGGNFIRLGINAVNDGIVHNRPEQTAFGALFGLLGVAIVALPTAYLRYRQHQLKHLK